MKKYTILLESIDVDMRPDAERVQWGPLSLPRFKDLGTGSLSLFGKFTKHRKNARFEVTIKELR